MSKGKKIDFRIDNLQEEIKKLNKESGKHLKLIIQKQQNKDKCLSDFERMFGQIWGSMKDNPKIIINTVQTNKKEKEIFLDGLKRLVSAIARTELEKTGRKVG